MVKAIDIWCNNFTPEGIRKNYVDDPEMQDAFKGKLREKLVHADPLSVCIL